MKSGLPRNPLLIKVLYVEQVHDTAQRILDLENGCRYHLHQIENGTVADFTVVRDCVSGFEQMTLVKFDILMINQHVKYVSGVEMIRTLRRFGYNDIPVIFITEQQSASSDMTTLARSLGYFGVLMRTTDFETFSRVLYDAFLASRGASSITNIEGSNSINVDSDERDLSQLSLSQTVRGSDSTDPTDERGESPNITARVHSLVSELSLPLEAKEEEEVDRDAWSTISVHEV